MKKINVSLKDGVLYVEKYTWVTWKGIKETGIDVALIEKFKLTPESEIVFIQKGQEPTGVFRTKVKNFTRHDTMLVKNSVECNMFFYSYDSFIKKPQTKQTSKELF